MSNKHDNVSRVKRPTPLGTSLFVGLRTLDVFLQYGFLAHGLARPLLNRLSISTPPAPGPVVALGLPLQPLLILAMAAGTALKQIYWVVAISQQEMPPAIALPIAIFNTLSNSINSILATTTAASALTPALLTRADNNPVGLSPLFILGTVLYVIGMVVETASEIQRRDFKAVGRNAGKPYTAGLFALARHINYGAFIVMRTGYALASGGWIWAAASAALFFGDFLTRGVPVLDDYCAKRYGASWVEFKKKVPYKLLPGIC